MQEIENIKNLDFAKICFPEPADRTKLNSPRRGGSTIRRLEQFLYLECTENSKCSSFVKDLFLRINSNQITKITEIRGSDRENCIDLITVLLDEWSIEDPDTRELCAVGYQILRELELNCS